MAPTGTNKHRVALVGTGHRGGGMWGKELIDGWSDDVEMVALCDINAQRMAGARQAMGTNAPMYTDFDTMLREVKPQ